MDEIEVPTEHLHETIKERAEEQKKKWSLYVAISTALMAVLAAMASLLAGHHSNEAVIEQIKASDQWSYYQAKSIKAEILTHSSLTAQDSIKIAKYNQDAQSIKKEAEGHEKEAEWHLSKHVVQARSVTLFQIAIAISAISILTEKRVLWFAGLLLSIAGLIFFIISFL